jgi:RNA polymerase sigma factor (sigma-70 family)
MTSRSRASIAQARYEQSGTLADLNDAVSAARQALNDISSGDPGRAILLNNLGSLLRARFERAGTHQDIEEAVRLIRSALEASPEGDPRRSAIMNNLGTMLSEVGRREEALAVTTEAVAIRRRWAEQNPDAYGPDLAMSLNNLGTMLSEVGRREEALAVTTEAVAIRRRWAEQNPDAYGPSLAAALNNLANRLLEAGNGKEAIPIIQEASDLYRRLAEANPGTYQPEVIISQSNIAGAYLVSGDVGRAVPLYEQVLADSRRVLGDDHPTTLSIRSSLASAYETAGDVGRAVPLYEQVLADSRRVLGDDHPTTQSARSSLASASVRSSLADFYESSGDVEPRFPLAAGPDLPPQLDDKDRTERDAAFSAFYRRIVPSLVAFLVWQGADISQAAELAQETMIQAYQHWPEIEYPETWVRRVASRSLIRQESQPGPRSAGHIPLYREASSDEVRNWEEQNEVIRLLGRLQPRERQVLAWSIDGFTPTEIARELGIPAATVRVRLSNARRNLTKIWKSESRDVDDR